MDNDVSVTFHNQHKIHARHVSASEIHGFVEAEERVFGDRRKVLPDTSEKKLKTESSGVRKSPIPIHSIVLIDEIESEDPARIKESRDNNAPFPLTPGRG